MDINAETLRQIRNKSGLSQSKFAELLGLKFRSYQNYELGHPIPDTKKELILYKLDTLNLHDNQKIVHDVENIEDEYSKEINEALSKIEKELEPYKKETYGELLILSLEIQANHDKLEELGLLKHDLETRVMLYVQNHIIPEFGSFENWMNQKI